jgi:DNA-directed RNA polymerase specialized sigma24 family protein
MALDSGLASDNEGSWSPRLTAEEQEILGRFVSEHQHALIAQARRLMDRYGVDELQIVAEGAVHGALLNLCRAQVANPARSLATLEDALAAFSLRLEQFIRDEGKRQRRIKRGGPGPAQAENGSPGVHGSDVDLDLIPSEMTPPELPVIAADAVHWRFSLLDRRDPSLRTIAAWRHEGLTNQEIAQRLHVSLSTIESRLREIRSIWTAADHS